MNVFIADQALQLVLGKVTETYTELQNYKEMDTFEYIGEDFTEHCIHQQNKKGPN